MGAAGLIAIGVTGAALARDAKIAKQIKRRFSGS
jgi:hypothetical protein